LIEWLGGPVDGSMFEAPDGSETIEVNFVLPYTISQAFTDGFLPMVSMQLSVESRNGKYYLQYPTNEQKEEHGL
jgi:hypothetical protein